jgi:hypothetical protein
MPRRYMVQNGAAPGAAAPVAVTTGTAIKTMLQLATPSTTTIKIMQWSISFDGSAAATPIKVELVETSAAATVTAFVAADITKLDDANAPPSLLTLSTTASGYTASGEGTPGTSRSLEIPQFIAPTAGLFIQYPLGQEIDVPVSKFVRIRVTAAAAVNCYCGVIWSE